MGLVQLAVELITSHMSPRGFLATKKFGDPIQRVLEVCVPYVNTGAVNSTRRKRGRGKKQKPGHAVLCLTECRCVTLQCTFGVLAASHYSGSRHSTFPAWSQARLSRPALPHMQGTESGFTWSATVANNIPVFNYQRRCCEKMSQQRTRRCFCCCFLSDAFRGN